MSKAVVSYKIDPKIKEILQKLATVNTRTVSNYLVTIIQDHLKAKDILWGAEEQHEENEKEQARFASLASISLLHLLMTIDPDI